MTLVLQLEADASGEQGEAELVEAYALAFGLGGELRVQIDRESQDESAAGFHASDSITGSIDNASTACDTVSMEITRKARTELEHGDVLHTPRDCFTERTIKRVTQYGPCTFLLFEEMPDGQAGGYKTIKTKTVEVVSR